MPQRMLTVVLQDSIIFRAVQSAGLAGQKPGWALKPRLFILPDRFEPTGPAKVGPAKKKPAQQTENRPGEKKPGR